MQVRAGGESSGSDVADGLTLAHALTAAQSSGESRHMSVERGVHSTMAQYDSPAIAALIADEVHLGVAGGLDGRAPSGGVVDAAVGAEFIQLGV